MSNAGLYIYLVVYVIFSFTVVVDFRRTHKLHRITKLKKKNRDVALLQCQVLFFSLCVKLLSFSFLNITPAPAAQNNNNKQWKVKRAEIKEKKTAVQTRNHILGNNNNTGGAVLICF